MNEEYATITELKYNYNPKSHACVGDEEGGKGACNVCVKFGNLQR